MSMAVTIGTVSHSNGSYRGNIATARFGFPVEIKPNRDKTKAAKDDKKPDFRILTTNNHEIGAGWLAAEKEGMGYRSINCRIADPSFGTLRFATGRMAGQDDADLYALIWNAPEGDS